MECIYDTLRRLLGYTWIYPIVVIMSIIFHKCWFQSGWPWGIDNAGYYILFYCFGDIFVRYLDGQQIMIIVQNIASILLLIVFSNVEYWTGLYSSYIATEGIDRYLGDVILAVLGIMGIIGLTKRLKSNSLLQFTGRQSMYIMVFHLFIIEGIVYLFMSFGITINQYSNSYCVFATVIAIATVLIPCLIMEQNKKHMYIGRES